jgi:hypothetical protein
VQIQGNANSFAGEKSHHSRLRINSRK